jgi:hypothetical protein
LLHPRAPGEPAPDVFDKLLMIRAALLNMPPIHHNLLKRLFSSLAHISVPSPSTSSSLAQVMLDTPGNFSRETSSANSASTSNRDFLQDEKSNSSTSDHQHAQSRLRDSILNPASIKLPPQSPVNSNSNKAASNSVLILSEHESNYNQSGHPHNQKSVLSHYSLQCSSINYVSPQHIGREFAPIIFQLRRFTGMSKNSQSCVSSCTSQATSVPPSSAAFPTSISRMISSSQAIAQSSAAFFEPRELDLTTAVEIGIFPLFLSTINNDFCLVLIDVNICVLLTPMFLFLIHSFLSHHTFSCVFGRQLSRTFQPESLPGIGSRFGIRVFCAHANYAVC